MVSEKFTGYQVTGGDVGFWGNWGDDPMRPAMTRARAEQFAQEVSTEAVVYRVIEITEQWRVNFVEDEKGNVLNALTGEIVGGTKRVRK